MNFFKSNFDLPHHSSFFQDKRLRGVSVARSMRACLQSISDEFYYFWIRQSVMAEERLRLISLGERVNGRTLDFFSSPQIGVLFISIHTLVEIILNEYI